MKVFKNFKETNTLRPGFSAEGIYGGTLLAVRTNNFICFYDWNTLKVCTAAVSSCYRESVMYVRMRR